MPISLDRQRCCVCQLHTQSWEWPDGRLSCSICGLGRQPIAKTTQRRGRPVAHEEIRLEPEDLGRRLSAKRWKMLRALAAAQLMEARG